MRPSSRASAEPRQKWVPTLNARCWRCSRWMSKTSPSGGNWRLVADRGADQHHHHAALGHGLAVVLDVAGDVAGDVRRGRLEAQQLLDGLRDQRRVLDQLAALVGVFGQHLAGPADEPRRGLVARARDDVDVDEQLLAGQLADVTPCSSVNSTLSSSVMMSSDGLSAAPVDVVLEDLDP